MSPFSPKCCPNGFLTIQYLVPSFGSTPQPIMAEERVNSSTKSVYFSVYTELVGDTFKIPVPKFCACIGNDHVTSTIPFFKISF